MKDRGLGGRELAAALLELSRLGIARRAVGSCLGAGLASRIARDACDAEGLRVLAPRGPFLRWIALLRARRHAVSGHDACCYAFGLAERETVSVLKRLGGKGAAELLVEALREAAAEVNGAPWDAVEATEALELHVRRRITPAVRLVDRGYAEGRDRSPAPNPPFDGIDQMPRSAPKSPASSRSFTWVRKRAASAPSIVR